MGRVAGAALTAVAPEARVVSKAAGAGRGRRPPVSDPRRAAPGSKAAQQRAEIEQIKAARPPDPVEPAPSSATSPPPASPGGGPSLPSVPAAVGTGSGFLLGVFVWAGALAYLQGGPTGVKKFIAAKFFNKA